jgi:hypothetical protein
MIALYASNCTKLKGTESRENNFLEGINLKTIGAYTQNTNLIFNAFKKLLSCDTIPCN